MKLLLPAPRPSVTVNPFVKGPVLPTVEGPVHSDGRLTARPSRHTGRLGSAPHAARERLRFGAGVLLFNPAGAQAKPAPVLVMLHGAGGEARDGLALVQDEAQRRGVLVLAPKSSGPTWDMLLDGFGPDVAAIDHALDHVFQHHNVDPARIAIGGFSDGASYALTLGLINGDLFGDTFAFSPGFVMAATVAGEPRVFLSHGRSDTVLPFALTGQKLAQDLEVAGFDVRFDAFEGGHSVPPDRLSAALDRWLETP